MPRLQSIQYLRALAATMVVVYHVMPNSFALIGAAGVDVFFVVSGFVMAVVSQRETRPLAFLRARVLRVVPLYWLSTAILVSAALLFPGAFAHLRPTAVHVLASFAFLPCVDPTTGLVAPVLVQGWTLQYEALFYVLMAAGLYFAPSRVLVSVGAILAVLAGVGALWTDKGPVLGVFLSPLLLEFLAGLAIGWLWRERRLPGLGMASLLTFVGLAGFGAAAVAGPAWEPYRVFACGVPSALLVLGAVALESANRMPEFPFLARIGDSSYALYLTHGFVVSVVGAIERRLPMATADSWRLAPALVLLCVVAALFVHRFVETPMLAALRAGGGRAKAPSLVQGGARFVSP